MRMPNAREISEEQQDIFEEAPLEGCILVSGPPGTGKTVIAFLRAQLIAKKKIDVTVLMFNRVLKRYTENVAEDLGDLVATNTMHTWFPEWWNKHKIQNHSFIFPIIKDNKVYLNCPYEEKENIKHLGGKWQSTHPLTNKKPGMWYVDKTKYESSPDSYEQWCKSYDPLKLDEWKFDWGQMKDIYVELEEDKMIDWGHIIIDEGQDFEAGFYSFLHMAGRQLEKGGITVLADENQRLEEEHHSSLQDIRQALRIANKPERQFVLSKNFRNTMPIAKLAGYFYVGLETGIPDLPNKIGVNPLLLKNINVEEQIKYICNTLKFRGALEVGIIVDNESDRKLFFEGLTSQLTNYSVQTYTSRDPQLSRNLVFDKQGIVSILNRKSCKGLEFDMVFVPQLQKIKVDDSNLTTFKMNMYVICSRARSELVFMCDKGETGSPEILNHFPSQDSQLIEYRELA